MPQDLYTRDAVSGVEYGPAYAQEHVRTIVATGSFNYTELKAYRPPRGADGALAILVDRTAAGNGTVPTGKIYVWIDNETTADNGTTILKPTSLGASDAGRWMQLSSVT